MQARIRWCARLLFALSTALMSGCGKGNPVAVTGGQTGSAVEQSRVSGTLAQTSPAFEDGLMESPDPAALRSASPGGADALIHPLHYWRRISDVRRTFEFAFSDTDSTGRPTRAVVTIRKYLAGTFNVAFDATPGDSTRFDSVGVVHKPLHDLWERRVLLRRVHLPAVSDDEWKLSAVSGAQVSSYDPARSTTGHLAFGSTRIVRLRIQSASGDTVIDDPLRFFLLRRIPAFGPNEDVTLTVTTMTNTDVVVLLRSGMRRRFHNNGDNTYTIFWKTSAEDGIHHIGVNALSNGTLFDDRAPYDSQAWLFPYRVKPTEVDELLP